MNELQRTDGTDDAPSVSLIDMDFEVACAVDLVNSSVTIGDTRAQGSGTDAMRSDVSLKEALWWGTIIPKRLAVDQ